MRFSVTRSTRSKKFRFFLILKDKRIGFNIGANNYITGLRLGTLSREDFMLLKKIAVFMSENEQYCQVCSDRIDMIIENKRQVYDWRQGVPNCGLS